MIVFARESQILISTINERGCENKHYSYFSEVKNARNSVDYLCFQLHQNRCHVVCSIRISQTRERVPTDAERMPNGQKICKKYLSVDIRSKKSSRGR